MTITKKGQDYSLNGVDWYSTSAGTYLLASNNLSDLVNTATARANLGVLSLTNATNNRVVTSSGGLVLNGEANLTFNGSTLTCTGDALFTQNVGLSNGILSVGVLTATIQPYITLAQASTGDASMWFALDAVGRNYTIGIDNTDDRFKIYGDAGLGETDALCGFVYDYNAGDPLVGIGENTPLYTLHVKGGFYVSGAFCNNLTFDSNNRSISPTNGAGTYSLTISGSAPSAGTGGALNLNGGLSANAAGGAAYLTGGDGVTVGGVARVRGGSATTTGGNVIIFGGDAATPGNVFIGDTSMTTYVQVGACTTPGTPVVKGILHIAGDTAVNTFPHLFLENSNNGFDTTAIFCWDATTYYSVGIDQSEARKFKIYNGTALGATAANIGFSFFVSGGLPYVGIGKDAVATYTLDVTGDIRVTDDMFVNDDITVGGNMGITGYIECNTYMGVSFSSANDTPVLYVANAGVGDASLNLFITGQGYTVGVDNSDGNKFKICGAAGALADLVTTDALCGLTYDYNAGAARVGIAESAPACTLDVGGITHIVGNIINQGAINYCVSATGNDTYVATLTPALTAYVAGQIFILQADFANAGACSLNVNGVGALNIKNMDGNDPANDDIKAGMPTILIYNGTNLILVSPQATGAP